VGRIPVITSTRELVEDDLVTILTTPRNALVKQYKRMFQLEGVELEFDQDALREIAREAVERETGARGLRSLCEAVLQDGMFDLPTVKDVRRVIVTADAVKGANPPLVETADGTREFLQAAV
jgi:ATP-dependent Clp protease ATP-binding subunit ClpX